MNVNLFRLALQQLQSSDWACFEILCSSFLVSEFSDLRTMAHSSGDGGRDSELFNSASKPFIAFQYSVTSDWGKKIRHTIERLSSKFPDVQFLIYMSNQLIGGQADELKTDLLRQGFSIDVRDRNWFLERATTDEIRENAALEIIDRIARPYLAGEEIINKTASPLSTGEAKAALMYLGLQLQDDITDKGLTKISFEALVRATLRHTNSEKRIPRSQIHAQIFKTLPSADKETLIQCIDSALSRLAKRYIRHWKKDDEFCLTHDESQRISIRLAELENQKTDFSETVIKHCQVCLEAIDGHTESDFLDIQKRIPRIIEKLLLRQGEIFVSAVLSNKLNRISYHDLVDIVLADLNDNKPDSNIIENYPKLLANTIQSLLGQADIPTRSYLRRLSNSYTLLSFLNQTPDVQSATRKLFSHGTIWLDTTVILPIIAEQLEENRELRRFEKILVTCSKMGVEFRVTAGVIQEINSHMNNALSCSQYQPGSWRGRIPYLYYQFLHTGQPPKDFDKWITLFRGNERPEDDLAQFLSEALGIKLQNLTEELENVDQNLQWAADRLWTEVHKDRRKNSTQLDEETTRILIKHDIETYLGVVALRQKEHASELGYKNWLLTFDKNAWAIRDRLKEEFKKHSTGSPLLSISFLINSLNFGPARSQMRDFEKFTLPLILDVELSESMPYDILEIADRVRTANEGLPEYVIRRKVRDAIDKARRRRGCFTPDIIPEDIEE